MRIGFFLILVSVTISCCSGDSILDEDGSLKDFIVEQSSRFLDALLSKFQSNAETSDQTDLIDTNVDYNNITLDDDCFYLIFEHLELSGLLKMAQISAKFYSIALYEFKQKYSNQVIRIEGELKLFRNLVFDFADILKKDSGNLKQKYTVDTTSQSILVEDRQFLLKIFQYFGCVIKRFQVRNFENGGVAKSIFRHLNQYSTESLVELHVIDILDITWLNEFKRPFPKVQSLSLLDYDEYPTFSQLKLEFSKNISEMFPNLRQLIYYNRRGLINAFPNESFPHLEYANIQFYALSHKRDRIDQFLQLNPQIRTLEVANFVSDYIVKIHSLIPNLEKLGIGADRWQDSIKITRPIHFEHVKSFSVRCNDIESLTSISFTNLQELRILYTPNVFVQWKELIQRNRNITRFQADLSLHTGLDDGWQNDFINHIVGLPPNILEITLRKGCSKIDKDTIVTILKRRPHLMKFTYKVKENTETEELISELAFDWNITALDYLDEGFRFKNLQFTRKI